METAKFILGSRLLSKNARRERLSGWELKLNLPYLSIPSQFKKTTGIAGEPIKWYESETQVILFPLF